MHRSFINGYVDAVPTAAMELREGHRVPALAGLLSAVSLALVFGAVLGLLPAALVPDSPPWVLDAIPHVNVLLSLAAITAIAVGWFSIRRGAVARHRLSMMVAVVLFATFLVLYLYRLTVLGGPADFPGPDTIYRFVYIPVLAIHVLLAVVCIPLLYYVLLLALTRPVRDIYGTNHARIGRIAASLWLISFALGVVVYLLLHVDW